MILNNRLVGFNPDSSIIVSIQIISSGLYLDNDIELKINDVISFQFLDDSNIIIKLNGKIIESHYIYHHPKITRENMLYIPHITWYALYQKPHYTTSSQFKYITRENKLKSLLK